MPVDICNRTFQIPRCETTMYPKNTASEQSYQKMIGGLQTREELCIPQWHCYLELNLTFGTKLKFPFVC